MLIRVLEIPPPTGHFHFGHGEPQTFVEVDWFRDDDDGPDPSTEEGRARLTAFLRAKRYFDPRRAYLVLHPRRSFTIGYAAP
jgi:hypothetical protein